MPTKLPWSSWAKALGLVIQDKRKIAKTVMALTADFAKGVFGAHIGFGWGLSVICYAVSVKDVSARKELRHTNGSSLLV